MMKQTLVDLTDIALKKLLFDLGTVSKLQKGEILDTTSDYMKIVSISFSSSLSRTFSGDSRQKAITRIQTYIQTVYEIGERILESKYLSIYEKKMISGYDIMITPEDLGNYKTRMTKLIDVRDILKGIPKGLLNLSITYAEDLDVVGRIQELISSTELKYIFVSNKTDEIIKSKEAFIFAQSI